MKFQEWYTEFSCSKTLKLNGPGNSKKQRTSTCANASRYILRVNKLCLATANVRICCYNIVKGNTYLNIDILQISIKPCSLRQRTVRKRDLMTVSESLPRARAQLVKWNSQVISYTLRSFLFLPSRRRLMVKNSSVTSTRGAGRTRGLFRVKGRDVKKKTSPILRCAAAVTRRQRTLEKCPNVN